MPVYPVSATWRDAKGLISWIRGFITGADLHAANANIAVNWVSRLQGASNAHLQNLGGIGAGLPVPPGYGTASNFGTCEDKARFVFEMASGARHHLDIPAPHTSMFLADTETLDVTAGPTVGIIALLFTYGWCDAAGHVPTNIIGGYRVRTKLHRRPGLYVKNPQLTTPAI